MRSVDKMSSEELVAAQSHLWNHIFGSINSLSLKCALQLGIPDAVNDYGKPVPLTELAKIVGIAQCRIPSFMRLMRLLVHNGFFKQLSAGSSEDVYELTTNSILLTEGRGALMMPVIDLTLDGSLLDPWRVMGEWFGSEQPSTTAFEMFHGASVWEATGKMPEFGRKMREGMGSDSGWVAGMIIGDGAHLFRGVKTLVEVAGGTGTMAPAIKEAFPDIKCTVLDLPHMIDAMEKSDEVEYVASDMFEHIPSADALILKWVCHGWSDEACVKLLKRCREAIPTGEDGGKAIIIDKVMDTVDGVYPDMKGTELHFDVHMMALTTGKQRTEEEWKKLFDEAGFKGYNIFPALGLRSIIEIYY